ncbi:hypothetical protein FHR84_002789 [Actinopolyspora biskrensis]|uniref:Uncharacterized protein n=1 Tax=Actinopolyspora biskrensis TaxID=1470178 RepID=A0A852YXU4_9ACTN|nr:hypothetical protein [Actinopolyspora biskrensis]NYH79451.1 hypothetical protein [Actinopolyspora biskrensis]
MAGPATAAQGSVDWKDGQGNWHTVTNPKGCYDTPEGRALNNKTIDAIELYSEPKCGGMLVYKVGVNKSVPPPKVHFESFKA